MEKLKRKIKGALGASEMPISKLCKYLGITRQTAAKKINNPRLLTLGEVEVIERVTGVQIIA